LETEGRKGEEQRTEDRRRKFCCELLLWEEKIYCCEGFQAVPACPFGKGRLEAKMNIVKRRRLVMGSGFFDCTTQKIR